MSDDTRHEPPSGEIEKLVDVGAIKRRAQRAVLVGRLQAERSRPTMSDDTKREMSLAEMIADLPADHRAQRELAQFKRETARADAAEKERHDAVLRADAHRKDSDLFLQRLSSLRAEQDEEVAAGDTEPK